MTINLQYRNMPRGMHGACTKNEDGSYTIFLDPRDDDEHQREGYLHELEHIQRGDLDNRHDKAINAIENTVHKKGLDTHGTVSYVSEEIPRRPGCP